MNKIIPLIAMLVSPLVGIARISYEISEKGAMAFAFCGYKRLPFGVDLAGSVRRHSECG